MQSDYYQSSGKTVPLLKQSSSNDSASGSSEVVIDNEFQLGESLVTTAHSEVFQAIHL